MALAEVVLSVMWVGVTLYAVFAGADFGAGFWDLLAGGPKRGSAQRELIEHSIGPVWEANHVWLIFVLVILWTAFPPAFAAIMTALYVPLTAIAVGIILRGAGFAFRKAVTGLQLRRAFGATFAGSSVITPFFLGAVAGAVASGRIPIGGDVGAVQPWLNPTSLLGGTLAVLVCAYLAATFLAADASRRATPQLAEGFRRRGLVTAVVTGGVAMAGIAVLAVDAPVLFDGLTERALPLIFASALGGLASIWLLFRRSYRRARVAAVLAVVAVIWGWGVAQHPFLIVDELRIEEAAGARSTMVAMLVALAIGGTLVAPSLFLLYWYAERGTLAAAEQGQEQSASPASR